MLLNKINQYLFIMISKYILLILFVFLSVAWLLQITRLFTITNFLHIEILDVFFLSIYLIPNLITVIVPFILIFGLLLCFLKLNKDNELIAILSLGFGLQPFKKTLIFFSLLIMIFFMILNLYLAPIVYEKYKFKENQLRNTINFNKMTFSNFLDLNNDTVLDFKRKNNEYNEIFINFTDDKENIIFAKKGNIINRDNEYNFQLTNGFKISIDNNKQIEKLEFLNYVLKIENKNFTNSRVIDNNTLTIIDDFNSKNYLNISFKLLDIILLIFIIIFFYFNNLKKINFTSGNNIYFVSLSIIIIIMNQMLKNSDIILNNYITVMSLMIFSIFVISYLKKKYE